MLPPRKPCSRIPGLIFYPPPLTDSGQPRRRQFYATVFFSSFLSLLYYFFFKTVLIPPPFLEAVWPDFSPFLLFPLFGTGWALMAEPPSASIPPLFFIDLFLPLGCSLQRFPPPSRCGTPRRPPFFIRPGVFCGGVMPFPPPLDSLLPLEFLRGDAFRVDFVPSLFFPPPLPPLWKIAHPMRSFNFFFLEDVCARSQDFPPPS